MSLDAVFTRAAAENRAALIGYIPAGFPDPGRAPAYLQAMVDGGADIVEVGVAYSDPLMDGPVIARAAEQALAAGAGPKEVFTATAAVRARGAVPVVMSYWNPILQYGPARFAADLAAAGGAGVITPDLIPDEAEEWIDATGAAGIDPIFLVAPSSSDERLALVTGCCEGFVYAASTMGVTGERSQVGSDARGLVERVRAFTELPVAVGLGVSNQAQAADIASYADGVIVGSALVRAAAQGPDAVRTLTAELRQGVQRSERHGQAGAS